MARLDQKPLRETFEYKNGGLYRKIPVRGSKVGARFGGVSIAGNRRTHYRRGKFNGAETTEHRLIWEYFNGPIPDGMQIDHIDQNSQNNAIENLRIVTPKANSRNKRTPTTNTSGVCGVYLNREHQYWYSQIKVDDKSIHLGCFNNLNDAAEARKAAEIKYGFHENHGA